MKEKRSRLSCKRKCKYPGLTHKKEVMFSLQIGCVALSSQSSNLLNQARLKVLQAQQQHIQNLLAESRTRLAKSSADRSNYTRVICDLIIQALFQV